MRRPGGIAALACSLSAAVALVPAVARASSSRAAPRLAREIVRTIRQDARRQVRDRAVTVERECCGRRTLRVHYRVPSAHQVLRDEYVLRIEFVRGRVRTIAVSEASEEEEDRSGIARRESEFEYALDRLPHGGRWAATISFGDGSSTAGEPGRPSEGMAGFTECHRVRPAPAGYYREVLMVLHNARRRVSSLASADPERFC